MISSVGLAYQNPSRVHRGPPSRRLPIQHPTIAPESLDQQYLILSTHRQIGFHACPAQRSWMRLCKRRRHVARKARLWRYDKQAEAGKDHYLKLLVGFYRTTHRLTHIKSNDLAGFHAHHLTPPLLRRRPNGSSSLDRGELDTEK